MLFDCRPARRRPGPGCGRPTCSAAAGGCAGSPAAAASVGWPRPGPTLRVCQKPDLNWISVLLPRERLSQPEHCQGSSGPESEPESGGLAGGNQRERDSGRIPKFTGKCPAVAPDSESVARLLAPGRVP
jgi:hypothetical protein